MAANKSICVEITKDTIKHVATLSRLAFNKEELDKFTDQMGSIINMADQLSEVDTEGVDETVSCWSWYCLQKINLNTSRTN